MSDVNDLLRRIAGARNGYAAGGAPASMISFQPMNSGVDTDRAFIENMYQNILGRTPDQAGVDYWLNQLETGALNEQQIFKEFANSAEFGGLYNSNPNTAISNLYQYGFDRAPDQAGLDYWTNQAKNGMGLGQMVDAFNNSAEGMSRHAINQMYFDIYNDLATRGQMGTGLDQLNSGMSQDAIRKNIFDTGWLNQEYQDMYGRAPDRAGELYWLDQLNNGTDYNYIDQQFSMSPEWANYQADEFIKDEYQGLLGRAPTQDELVAGRADLLGGMDYGTFDKRLSATDASQAYQASNFDPYQVAGQTVAKSQPRTGWQWQEKADQLWKTLDTPTAIGGLLSQEGGMWLDVLRKEFEKPGTFSPQQLEQAKKHVQGIINNPLNRAAIEFSGNGGVKKYNFYPEWWSRSDVSKSNPVDQIRAPAAYSAAKSMTSSLVKEGYDKLTNFLDNVQNQDWYKQTVLPMIQGAISYKDVDPSLGSDFYYASYLHPKWAKPAEAVGDLGGGVKGVQGGVAHLYQGSKYDRATAIINRGTAAGLSAEDIDKRLAEGGLTRDDAKKFVIAPMPPGRPPELLPNGNMVFDNVPLPPIRPTSLDTDLQFNYGPPVSIPKPPQGPPMPVPQGPPMPGQQQGGGFDPAVLAGAGGNVGGGGMFNPGGGAIGGGTGGNGVGPSPTPGGGWQPQGFTPPPPQPFFLPPPSMYGYATGNPGIIGSMGGGNTGVPSTGGGSFSVGFGAANGGRINKNGGGSVDDALRRMGFSEGGSGPDEDERERWLRDQLAGSARQYVEENDFPARASRAVEAADRYAGAANNALASFAGAPSMRSPEGRSAGEIISSAIPQDPNQVSKDALERWNSGDRIGAAETMLSMPQAGMFLGPKAKTADLAALNTAKRDLQGSDAPRPYGDLFDRVAVAPKSVEEVRQGTGWHPLGENWWFETADHPTQFTGKDVLDKRVEENLADIVNGGNAAVLATPQKDLRRLLRSELIANGYEGTAKEYWNDPNLWRAYPDLGDTRVVSDAVSGPNRIMSGDPRERGLIGKIGGKPVIVIRGPYSRNQDDGAQIITHELQHGIQEREGAPHGSDPDFEKKSPSTNPAYTRYQEALLTNPDLQFITEQRASPEYMDILEESRRTYAERLNQALRGGGGNRTVQEQHALASQIASQVDDHVADQYSLYGRVRDIERNLAAQGIPIRPPKRLMDPFQGYLANAGEAQARNNTYRLGWDMGQRNATSPLLTMPKSDRGDGSKGFYDPMDLIYRIIYANGGRVGFADGGVPEDDEDKSRFIREQLNSGEKQLPQYDPEAGWKTAKNAALTAYGMTDLGGAQQAFGYMPKAEGGYEPSVAQDFREGHYLPAALGAMGVVVPGAGRAAKVVRAAEEAAPVARAAKAAAPVAEAAAPAAQAESKLWTPSAPKIIRPGEDGAPTVGAVLAKNGYTDIPDKDYIKWRGVLDEPASKHTQGSLMLAFQDALKEHLALPDGMRRQNTREAMRAAVPYLGESEKGVPYDLLTQNMKQSKAAAEAGVTNSRGNPVDTWGLSLSPALDWEALKVCGNDAICRALCLGKKSGGYALEGAMNNEYQINLPRSNSLGRTMFMMQRPREFAIRYADEMRALEAEAAKNGMDLGMRNNTLSDLHPSTWAPFRQAFPNVDFYDYTKHNVNAQGQNHHLTYSSTGHSSDGLINQHSNWAKMMERIHNGDNVAIVLNQKHDKPKLLQYLDDQYEVRNGDEHDFRPFDQQEKGKKGVFVALGKKEQGKGTGAKTVREKSGGFYFDYWPETDGDVLTVPDQRKYEAQEKAMRKKKAGGGGVEVDHDIWRGQFHNGYNFEDAAPGTRKIPHWWEQKGSKRKAG